MRSIYYSDLDIIKLTRMGKVYQKGTSKRLYLGYDKLGVELDYGTDGKVASAHILGDKVDSSYGSKVQKTKFYINMNTGELIFATPTTRRVKREIDALICTKLIEATIASLKTVATSLAVGRAGA